MATRWPLSQLLPRSWCSSEPTRTCSHLRRLLRNRRHIFVNCQQRVLEKKEERRWRRTQGDNCDTIAWVAWVLKCGLSGQVTETGVGGLVRPQKGTAALRHMWWQDWPSGYLATWSPFRRTNHTNQCTKFCLLRCGELGCSLSMWKFHMDIFCGPFQMWMCWLVLCGWNALVVILVAHKIVNIWWAYTT